MMLQLSTDHTFHFELLRVMGTSRSYGADVAEVLTVAEKLIPGDFESWFAEFEKLADHVASGITGKGHPVTERNALFRVANYYRATDFFLHGNAADPRINTLWEKQTRYFDEAIARLPIPGERITVSAPGLHIPAILYRASKSGQPLPTLFLG